MTIQKQQRSASRSRPARRPKTAKPLGRVIADLGSQIPGIDLRRFPTDGAANHDHYLYGTPRQHKR